MNQNTHRMAAGPATTLGSRVHFPFTTITLAFAIAMLLLAVFWHIDIFALPGVNVIGIEQSELGEVVIPFLLIVPAFLVDAVVRRQHLHEAQLQAERLRVLQATMRTVQDVVSNGLMSLYLFRIEAEPTVSPQSLELFDRIVAEIAAKLKAIAETTHVTETEMAIGPGIAYPSSPPTGQPVN